MKTKTITLCAMVTAIICICSAIRVNLFFTPIPFTLQTYAVFLAAAVLGSKSVICVFLYLLLGAMGLPVFSGMTSGLGVLFGPTGGFLFSFLPASLAVGIIFDKHRLSLLKSTLAFSAGLAIIYFCGTVWLSIYAKISLINAVSSAVAPFILLDICKIFIAAVSYRHMVRLKFEFLTVPRS